MAEATNALENEISDYLAGRAECTLAGVGGAFVGLITAVTDAEAGTVTECAGTGYARSDGALSTGNMGAASNGVSASTAAITYGPATAADWGTITHAGIWSASTAGTLLAVTALDASKAVGDGDTFEFAIGDFTVTVT
jgi:hypothetical protein